MNVIHGKVKDKTLSKSGLEKMLKGMFGRLEEEGLVPEGTAAGGFRHIAQGWHVAPSTTTGMTSASMSTCHQRCSWQSRLERRRVRGNRAPRCEAPLVTRTRWGLGKRNKEKEKGLVRRRLS